MPHAQDDTRTPDDPQRNVSGDRPERAVTVTDAGRTQTAAELQPVAAARGASRLLSTHAQDSQRKRQADERVLSQSQVLIAQTRQLDSRLNVASQTDRQLERRAAGLVTQLARRLSVLLSRTSSVLPMLPGHGNRRVNHYVVHAERAAADQATTGRVRLLTIGSNGMLRVGSTDSDALGIVWMEYDPFMPAPGWDLETVVERLTAVVVRIEGHVDAVESRVRERSRALETLTAATVRKTSATTTPAPIPNPLSPLLSMSHAQRGVPGAPGAPASTEQFAQAMEAAMEQDLDVAMSGAAGETAGEKAGDNVGDIFPVQPVTAQAPDTGSVESESPTPGSLDDAKARYERSRHKRQLFDRLR